MRVIALGFFDGVHKGHKALLQVCKTIAAERNLTPTVLTFSSPPISKQAHLLLTTKDEKTALFTNLGIEELLFLPFDETLKKMHWRGFAALLKEQYAAQHLVIGTDFRFGHKAEGDAAKLAIYCEDENIGLTVLPKVLQDGREISASRIKALLLSGKLEEANALLSAPYFLSGTVQEGNRRGRTIGYRTINILPPKGKLLPPLGVYKTTARIGNTTFAAITNIGTAPTFNVGEVRAETHLLAPVEGDFYGETAVISFLRFIREEKTFASGEELAAQIKKDITAAAE